MTWMSWRQFRLQALVGVVALTVLAAYLLRFGVGVRDAYDASRSQCPSQGGCGEVMARFSGAYQTPLLFLAALLGLIPTILGMFWGAPLVARELEAGTNRLVWNQSVTRRRWLTVKLGVVGLAAMAVAALASLLLTWAAGPVDHVAGDRFTTVVFGARNIAPIAYAAFAVSLGTTIGLLVRRTVPAIALTILTFTVFQFAVPNLVRPHLMASQHVSRPMTADAINQARALGSITGAAVVKGLTVPDAWVTHTSELLTADGRPLARDAFDDCFSSAPKTGATGTFGDTAVCLGDLDLHVDLAFQPNHRYWPFQWIESALYLGLAALLTAFGLWRIQRRPN